MPTEGLGQDRRLYVNTLTDVEKGIYKENWSISSRELGVGVGWHIEKCRLHGGLSDGIDIITVNNGELSFIIVPTRGMGIWKGEYKENLLSWASPIKELVHPHYMNLEEKGGLGWLNGFNEWIVRCGLSSFGAPDLDTIRDNQGREKRIMLTLHGKIANIPASKVKVKINLDPPHDLEIEGVVHECSMFGPKLKLTTSIMTTPSSGKVRILDTIENMNGVPDEMQLLYHCNYGSPFLEENSHLVAPIRRIAPRDATAMKGIQDFNIFGPPTKGFIEQVFFIELLTDNKGLTNVMLVNSDGTKAASISFSMKELPCFTLWKNTSSTEEGYVVGLEPGTSYPNFKGLERERNRVVRLEPGERFSSEVTLSILVGQDEVDRAIQEIKRIQEKTIPTIYKKPISEFSSI